MARKLRIALIDYGAGNLRSVAKALLRSGMDPEVTNRPEALRLADAIVLPGVGAFADAVRSLRAQHFDEALLEAIRMGKPYLGFCLGLQMLFEEGAEHGPSTGLGIFKGRVERFPVCGASGAPLRVPHIGWNEVVFDGAHPLLAQMPKRDFFYFVHSYRVVETDADVVVGRTDYGGVFASAVAKDNLFAVQFHPEKSQRAGKRLLDAFAQWIQKC